MTRQEKIQNIVSLIMTKNYGDVIKHQDIISLIGERGITQSYRDVINTASRRCIDGGKMIESVHGVGYRIVNPDEYTEQSIRCVASGAKKIDRGAKILMHAPVRDMSQDGLERYNLVSDKMRVLNAALAGAKVEIRMLNSSRKHPLAIQGNNV